MLGWGSVRVGCLGRHFKNFLGRIWMKLVTASSCWGLKSGRVRVVAKFDKTETPAVQNKFIVNLRSSKYEQLVHN